jgi:RHS repeat-associated protein
VAWAFAAMLCARPSRAADPLLDPHAPDVVLAASICDKAAELGLDPVRIFEFLHDEFEFQPYYGLMKGPEATLRSRGGNDYDLSALLVSMLRCAGTPARFVRGKVQIPVSESGLLTGAGDTTVAEARLEQAQPFIYRSDTTAAMQQEGLRFASGGPDGLGIFHYLHVWVEAQVPEARYRGSSGVSNPGAKIWVALDPSFKRSLWRPSSGLQGLGTGPLAFDYTSPQGLYAQVTAKRPLEIYEEQLQKFLSSTTSPVPGDGSVDGIAYRGEIIREAAGVLPNALPYPLSGDVTPQRDALLENLHVTTSGKRILSAPIAENGGPSYRYSASVSVCADGTAGCDTTTSAALLGRVTSSTAAWAGHRVSVWFPSVLAAGSLPTTGYAQCSVGGNPINVRPQISVDGEELLATNLPYFPLCSNVVIVVRVDLPLGAPFGGRSRSEHHVGAGGIYVASFGVHDSSGQGTAEATQALLAEKASLPIAFANGEPFIDTSNPPNGVKNAGEFFLAQSIQAQERLTGSLLQLASAWYRGRDYAAERRIDGLFHRLPFFYPGTGLVSAGRTISVLFDVPFSIQPAKLLIDLKGGLIYDLPATYVPPPPAPAPDPEVALHREISTLLTHEGSALEHTVWQELAAHEAVSTVKGLQLLREFVGRPLLTLHNVAEANAATSSCTSTGCTAIDQTTYCTIKASFGTTGTWKAAAWDSLADCQNGVPTGAQTLDLRITDQSRFTYRDWDGSVYYRIMTSGVIETYEAAINPGTPAGGGYALDYGVDPLIPGFFNLPPSTIDSYQFDPISFTYLIPEQQLVTAGDPVSVVNGSYNETHTDIDIAGPGGMNLRLVRSYNSRLGDRGPLGFGWTTTFDQHLRHETATSPDDKVSDWVPATNSPGGALTRDGSLATSVLFPTTTTTYKLVFDDWQRYIPAQHRGRARFAGIEVQAYRVGTTGSFSIYPQNYPNDVWVAASGAAPSDTWVASALHSLSTEDEIEFQIDGNASRVAEFRLRVHYTLADDRVVWVDEMGDELPFFDTGTELVGDSSNFHALKRVAGGGFVLTTKSGMVLGFRPFPQSGTIARLDYLRDRNGNTISCSYNVAGDRLLSVTAAAGSLTFSYDGAGNLSDVADWAGRHWHYTVDGNGDLIELRDPIQFALGASAKPWKYTYHSEASDTKLKHNIACWIRPEGNQVASSAPALCGASAQGHAWMSFSYYPNDTVFSHTDSLGRTTQFSYNYLSKRTDVTQPDGARELYFYDAYGNVTQTVSPGGKVHLVEYDAPRRLPLVQTDAFGHRSSANYDGRGNMTQRTDRLTHTETFTYNGFSQVTSWTDRRGNVHEWKYDNHGNLLSEAAEIDGATQSLSAFHYDAFGNRIQSEVLGDPRGLSPPATTKLEFGPGGLGLRRVIDALGRSTRFDLDVLARPMSVARDWTVAHDGKESPSVVSASTRYDALDRPEFTTNAIGVDLETQYDADGLVVERRSVEPGPKSRDLRTRIDAHFRYDIMGRLVSRMNGRGDTSLLEYDLRDRVAAEVSPSGRRSTVQYDLDGNLVRRMDAAGNAWTWTYDAENRVLSATDPESQTARNEYDVEGRTVRSFGPNGRLVSYVRLMDELGNPRETEDAAGHVTRIIFDELSRPKQVTAALGTADEATTTNRYDLAGRLVQRTDAEGRLVEVRYDALGRVTQTSDPLGRTTALRYDELGNPIEVTNGAGERVLREYDALGNLLQQSGAGVLDRYSYDSRGRLKLEVNDTASRGFEYDALDRPTAITDGLAGTERRRYDSDGQLVQLVYPNTPPYGSASPAVTTYQYDALGRIVGLSDPIAGSWKFFYDGVGRLLQVLDSSNNLRTATFSLEGFVHNVAFTSGSGDVETIGYSNYDALGNPRTITSSVEGPTQVTYDARSRVKQVSYPKVGGGTETETFDYDRVGNRLHHTDRTGVAKTYGLDAADQLKSISVNGAVVDAFDYDGAGRRIRETPNVGSATNLTYDALSRLVKLDRGASYKLRLTYDPSGRRYRRFESGQPTATFPSNLVETRDGSSVRLVTLGGSDRVLAEVTGTSTKRLLLDAQRNVVGVTDGGAMLAKRRYETFGRVRSTQGSTTVERGYAGMPSEGASGLVYMGARHYDPAVGRFLQTDPLGIDSDQLYAYAASNPYRFVDPLGLGPEIATGWEQAEGFAEGAVVGGAIGYGSTVALTALHVACLPCALLVDAGLVGVAAYGAYSEYQSDFAGLRGLGDSATALYNGEATYEQAYAVGGAAAGIASAAYGLGAALSAERAGAEELSRVGRWMSEAEHEAMVTSGRVEESTLNGVTSVTHPPDPMQWIRQTDGGRFVEFDVPTSALRANGTKIYGPNSVFGKGLGITEMPPGTSIEHVASKWPRRP